MKAEYPNMRVVISYDDLVDGDVFMWEGDIWLAYGGGCPDSVCLTTINRECMASPEAVVQLLDVALVVNN